MMLVAWLAITILGGLLLAEYNPKPKKKRVLKRKSRYEKQRAKIRRIK